MPSGDRNTTRAVVQRLEDLQRAGVTHLPKCRRVRETHQEGGEPNVEDQREQAGALHAASPAGALHAPYANIAPETPCEAGELSPAEGLAAVQQRVAACTRCAELARTRTQTVFGDGNPRPTLVFMGEAPGADEDRQGRPFVGAAGQKLTEIIVKGMGLRREDVYILNTIKCRPPGNRTPLPDEVANCREYLDEQLALLRPRFLCCLGAVAAQSLLESGLSIGELRGRVHDYHGMKVVCTYHPAYLLRNPDARRHVWEDIKLLMAQMGLKVPGKKQA